MKKTLVIIDGNSLINRAYYAMQRPMMTKEGIYTQAIYGFINMLNKIRQDYEPDYIAVAWDLKAPTFRHKEYSDYKAGRKKMPPELAMQLPLMKDVLAAMHIPNLSLEGFEADDIIGTLAKKGEAEGLKPLIITGDKDALQLAGHDTKVLITKKGISEFELYDHDKMLERYELTPEQFIDLKGLMGDSSDNIPGIPGVGEKTGINLLKQFGSIEEMLQHTDEITSPKLREKVEEHAALARMSRKLAEIITNVPIEINFDDLKTVEPDYPKLVDIYSKLEFNSFLKKLNTQGVMGEQLEMSGSPTINNIDLEDVVKDAVSNTVSDVNSVEDALPKNDAEIYIKIMSDNNHINMPVVDGIGILYKEKNKWIFNYFVSEAVDKVIELIGERNYGLSGHGLVSDEYVLLTKDAKGWHTTYDTEVAEYLLNSSRSGYTLKALAMENLHLELKDEKELLKETGQMDLLGSNDAIYSQYVLECLSAVVNLRIIQEAKLKEYKLESVFKDVELPLIEVLASMEKEGFKTEEEELRKHGKELESEIETIVTDIYKLAGKEFNINSTQQLGVVLFDELNLPHGKKTKTGYSTGAEVLEKIKVTHPIVEQILRYRTLSKLKSTYVDGLIPLIAKDGKIHAHFRQTVTATGRISCTEPNLQNIPIRNEEGRLIRKAFVPSDENHTLIGADYSQIELRVLAHLSGDEGLIDAFNKGDDIHRATASRVFNIPYDEVSSLDRSRAKAVNFGVIYGMSGFGLAEELGIGRYEAEKYIKDYFANHEKVKKYMDGQKSKCRERGYTETLLGRRRYIPEIKSSNFNIKSLGERLAMNSPIQGSAADIIKVAMIKVYNELKEKNYKSKLILQVHDELIIDTDISEEEAVKELLIRNMMEAVDLKVELVSDLNYGNTWYDLK